MRFLFSASLIFITTILSSQERVDTLSLCPRCYYEVRTFDSNNIIRISCQYNTDSITLERETIFGIDGRFVCETYFGDENDRDVFEWNSMTKRKEVTHYNSAGELKWWYEIPTDSIDARTVSFYSFGLMMEEGYQAIVDAYEPDCWDSVTITLSKLLPYKNETKVGFWRFYYLDGGLAEEGNYARFCIMDIDTSLQDSQGEIISICSILQSDGIKTGIWNYYSPEGKLIRREEWDKGNLLKRETF